MINRYFPVFIFTCVGLFSCSLQKQQAEVNTGRYEQHQDSGPDEDQNVDDLADAVPRWEPQTIAGNRSPYQVLGKKYEVLPSHQGYLEEGVASWYGKKFHGHKTANGEIYDMFAMSAAHKTLPIPSYARITNLSNQKQVIVRINDRGPFHEDRLIDLSYAAAKKLGFHLTGTARVKIESIMSNKAETPKNLDLTSMASQKVHKAALLPENTFLQVGAFSEEQKALAIRQQLSALVKVPVLVVPHQTRSLYRVRLGPIADHWQLANMRSLLAEHRFNHTQVVTES